MQKTVKTTIVALGLLMGCLAQAKVFDDFSSGNLLDNWSTPSTDTGLAWSIEDGVLAFRSAAEWPGSATYVSHKQDFKLVGTPEKPLVVFIELPLEPFFKHLADTGQFEAFTFGVRDRNEQSLSGTINFTATGAGLSGNMMLFITGAPASVNWHIPSMSEGDKLVLNWDGATARFFQYNSNWQRIRLLTNPVTAPANFRFADDSGALFMTYHSRQGTPPGDGKAALTAIGVMQGQP